MTALDPDLLLHGYASGVFPMSDSRDAADLFWVEPRQRAILPLDAFHLSRSLARRLCSGRFRVTADRAFAQVIVHCADRDATWINPAIEGAVNALHARGQAHSIEVWDAGSGALAGGLYGVRLGRAFFGESMFSTATDASKVALAWLVARLRLGAFTLLDCQFMTDHLASLGAVEIPRQAYLAALSVALSPPSPDSPPADWSALDDRLATPALSADIAASGKLITQLLGHTS
jgi:leucyl/phenylalanyl-tRNA---protein transferase